MNKTKTKVNIICVLIFMTIGFSIVSTTWTQWHDMVWGWQQGNEKALQQFHESGEKDTDSELTTDLFLTIQPTITGNYVDSVYNEKTQSWTPSMQREIGVGIKGNHSAGFEILTVILMIITIASNVMQFVVFILLIKAINRLIVFDWSNVLKLRLLGIALVINFFAFIIYGYIHYHMNVAAISIPNYTIVCDIETWNLHELLLGLGCLLMSQIFAMGLKMKEEQELTI